MLQTIYAAINPYQLVTSNIDKIKILIILIYSFKDPLWFLDYDHKTINY